MFGLRRLNGLWSSEAILFVVLLGLALFFSGQNLIFGYGITFSFASIFIFLVLRLFGLPMAVFVMLLTFLVVPREFTFFANNLLLLFEIIFVGSFFLRGRKAKMFFVDAFFWLTIGLIAVFLFNQAYLSGDALYFQICKKIINGCFNVLIADMLLAYFPFYKFFRNNKLNKNTVSIHQFLSHITLISILIPFFLSVGTSVWNTEEVIKEQAVKQAEKSASRIKTEFLQWNIDDFEKLLISDTEQISRLNALIERNSSEEFDIIISSGRNQVIASSTSEIEVNNEYDWYQIYNVERMANHFYEVLPKNSDHSLPIIKWRAGKYIYVNNMDLLPIKLTIQFPITQFQDHIFKGFLDQLKYSFLFAVGLILLVLVVSRLFMENLKQLISVTTGLPQKLISLETVEWPRSYVSELRLLTQNLMKMSDKLTELFQESNEMNRKLTDQTNKLKVSEDKLHQLAYYDVLTQLPNRLNFQNYVKGLIGNQQKFEHIAIVFIDINQFKQINDTLGHDAGDMLLRLTADKLSGLHTDTREVFRLGGDEFVIVHSVETPADISSTIDEINKRFSSPFQIQGQAFYITASVGISMYPEDGEDLNTLVKCADIAMYISKEKGGNVAQFFNESMRDKFQERLMIENALRTAVESGGFEIYYQPKTHQGKVTSMEALLRWKDPELGDVSPSTFIPIAEEIGLVLSIDSWSLIEACLQNKKWQDEGFMCVPISVNLSAKHFQQDYLFSMVERALQISGLNPKYLKLEITESVFIKNPKHVAVTINKIKELGVFISIDDFGKGYSSLYQLLQLPIDEIKIDRQFIKDMDLDKRKVLLVKSIIDMGHGLDLNVVAEGVETEREKRILVELGCDELQGFLFSPPIRREEMAKYLCLEYDRLNV